MKLTKDSKVWIPDTDFWSGWGLGYETKHWNSVVPYLSQTRTAIDVGAHVGIWSMRMGSIFDKVVSFEPVPAHIECFNENLKLFDNVSITECAISDKNDSTNMKVTDYNSGSSTLEYSIIQKNTKHKVAKMQIETRTLDSFNLTDVDFIKMDVEGHEISAIRGAEQTIINNSPVIFIEVFDRSTKKVYTDLSTTALQLLLDLGYVINEYVGSGNYICTKT